MTFPLDHGREPTGTVPPWTGVFESHETTMACVVGATVPTA
jgi:hypothetical protein